MKFLIITFVFAAVIQLAKLDNFYSGSGPAGWPAKYPLCGGKSQTPINIEKDSVKCENTRLRIRYLDSDIESVTLKNDGHGFVFLVNFEAKTPRILQWIDRRGKVNEYIFHSAHIHWGNDCDGGSEHTVNGHRFAAEMHLVHYSTKYPNLTAAMTKSDGLAVLGVFFEVADQTTYDSDYENQFAKYLKNITKENDTVVTAKCDYKNILDLIKYDVKDFYSYQGSLTTPGCFESVRWLVSAEPIRIYPSELQAMRAVFPSNYRPLQALNGRTVIGSCR